jgi:transposase
MAKAKTSTFLLELPLRVDAGQARRLRAHLEVARTFYNAMLGEGNKRLRLMRADPAWQQARALSHALKQERSRAFRELRQQYRFSAYDLHAYATQVRACSWIAEHLDANTAQTLASRAFHACNRVCLGQARRVRFRSRGRGLESVEGKSNKQGLRFVLQEQTLGSPGWLIWRGDRIPALIDWHDPVIQHGLQHRIKFVRLLRRTASSERARGADCDGNRYYVQLALEGKPYLKPKNHPGSDTIGLDIGPSTLATFPRQGEPEVVVFCEEVQPNARKKRRVQRKLERQRRANNPENYDAQGRVKKGRLSWKKSKRSLATQRQLAHAERRLAAHRKSLHGHLVNRIIHHGNQITIEHTSFRGWQKVFGKSVGLRAPGMFYEHLKRTVAKTGGSLRAIGTYRTKLSQYCHGCQTYRKKPLRERWHHCACGIGPIQRDLYSAFLLAHLEEAELIPSISQPVWEGAEPRLRAEVERLTQRAKAGQALPQSVGIPHAGARRLTSPSSSQQESILSYQRGRWKALGLRKEPLVL